MGVCGVRVLSTNADCRDVEAASRSGRSSWTVGDRGGVNMAVRESGKACDHASGGMVQSVRWKCREDGVAVLWVTRASLRSRCLRPSRGSVWARRREDSRSSGESVVEASLYGGDKRRKSSSLMCYCSRECGYE